MPNFKIVYNKQVKNPVKGKLSATPSELYLASKKGIPMAKDMPYNPDSQGKPSSSGFEVPLENTRSCDISDLYKAQVRAADKKKAVQDEVKAYRKEKERLQRLMKEV